jgi:antitoxin (DNA-binding transcriptional repressor) of toxin-antitoxin stability system
MAQFNIHEAKTKLSQLIAMAERGEEVVIARDGEPCAILSPFTKATRAPRVFGQLKGLMKPADIDDAFSTEADAELIVQFDRDLIR